MYNQLQTRNALACPKYNIQVDGRATGKSSDIGRDTKLKCEVMPRAVGGFVTRNFKIALERSLPAMLKVWEELLGWHEYNPKDGGDYVLFSKPPAHWPKPYSKRIVPERCIFTSTGTAIQLITQEREDSARGFDLDFIQSDEGLTLKPEHFKRNVIPALRGNRGKFNTHMHHGFSIYTSMGWDAVFQWILDYGNYYPNQYEQLHRLLPDLYLSLIDAPTASKRQEIWQNHILPIKKQLIYYVSKDDVYYSEGTAFDNLANVGFEYILNLRRNMSDEEFLIEVLNMRFDVAGEAFYPDTTHMCYDMDDDSGLESALGKGISLSDSCLFDADLDKSRPIDFAFDAQASINPWTVGQMNEEGTEYRVLKDGHDKKAKGIKNAVQECCDYYSATCKVVNVVYDHTFVAVSANQTSTIDDVVSVFRANGWQVRLQRINQQPGHYERYRMWDKLSTGNYVGPKIKFNYERTKTVRRAMQLTKVSRSTDNGFKKDKRNERKETIDQSTTTHYTDTVDSLAWWRFGESLKEHSYTKPLIL
jgi:hypothetical protein